MGINIKKISMGKSNSYLIEGKSGLILVDAGMPDKTEILYKVLNKNNFNFKDISLIIVTHVHNDHVGSLYDIKKRSNAPVLIHKFEEKHLKKGFVKFPKGTMLFSKIISNIGTKLFFSKEQFKSTKADIIIKNNYNLDKYGVNGQVIHTPGHTNGSISVILENKLCIVGDTFFNWFPNSVYPPFANDEISLVKSWKKIKKYNCRVFYPGHGKKFGKEKFEKSLDKIL